MGVQPRSFQSKEDVNPKRTLEKTKLRTSLSLQGLGNSGSEAAKRVAVAFGPANEPAGMAHHACNAHMPCHAASPGGGGTTAHKLTAPRSMRRI